MEHRRHIQEDEVDLRKVFLTIWRYRLFIAVFTLTVTAGAALYAWNSNPKPLYKGMVLVEIGEMYGEVFGARALDNADDLAVILEKRFPVNATVPKRSRSLILLSSKGANREQIKSVLQKSMKYIQKRHGEKARHFQTISKTKTVTDITVSKKPINTPNRKMIVEVAFVIAVFVSIFLVLLKEFALSMRKENYEN